MFEHIEIWEIESFENGNSRPNNPDDSYNEFSKNLNMRSASIRKHATEIWGYGINIYEKTCNRNLVIWNQYPSENMNWKS